MVECPFFSSKSERVKCFNDCALFKYEGNDGVCPFKTISVYKSIKFKNLNFDTIDKFDQQQSIISYERLLR